MDPILVIALCSGIGVAALLLGILIGFLVRKAIAKRKLGTAEERAKQIEADSKMKAEMEANKTYSRSEML